MVKNYHMALRLGTFTRILILLALTLSTVACDTATPLANIPTATLGSSKPLQTIEPVSQGWVIELSSLTKEDNYTLNFDVLGSGGWPVGALTVARGQSYEQQGKPDLISTVSISAVFSNSVTADHPMLELAASRQSPQAGGSPVEEAQVGHTYEKISTQGYRVRATVQRLTIDSSPKLTDGSIGQIPTFGALTLDVEVTGRDEAPYLGLTAADVIRSRAAAENLRGSDLQLLDHGVVLRDISPGGPADKAGLQAGDVILSLNDKRIDDVTPLSLLVSHYKAGDKVSLEVVRNTKLLRVDATLERRP